MDCPLYGIGERLVVGHMQLVRIWNVLKVKAMRSLADRNMHKAKLQEIQSGRERGRDGKTVRERATDRKREREREGSRTCKECFAST